jgi:hypothetical protein
MQRVHPSHKTRISDASTFDEICDLCGAHDQVPGGLGDLVHPCPMNKGEAVSDSGRVLGEGRYAGPPAEKEQVDHPAHYGGGDNPFETIKVLRAWLTPEQYTGFLLGNALKYLSRVGKKGNALTDVEKARWYATAYTEFLKETAK